MDVWTWVAIIGGAVIVVGGIWLIARPSKRDRELQQQLDEREQRLVAERERPVEPRPALYEDFASRPRVPTPDELDPAAQPPSVRAERVTRPSGARRNLPPPTSRMGRLRRTDDDPASPLHPLNPMFTGADSTPDRTPDRHDSGTGGHGGTPSSDQGGSPGGGSYGGGGYDSGGGGGGGSYGGSD